MEKFSLKRGGKGGFRFFFLPSDEIEEKGLYVSFVIVISEHQKFGGFIKTLASARRAKKKNPSRAKKHPSRKEKNNLQCKKLKRYSRLFPPYPPIQKKLAPITSP